MNFLFLIVPMIILGIIILVLLLFAKKGGAQEPFSYPDIDPSIEGDNVESFLQPDETRMSMLS